MEEPSRQREPRSWGGNLPDLFKEHQSGYRTLSREENGFRGNACPVTIAFSRAVMQEALVRVWSQARGPLAAVTTFCGPGQLELLLLLTGRPGSGALRAQPVAGVGTALAGQKPATQAQAVGESTDVSRMIFSPQPSQGIFGP